MQRMDGIGLIATLLLIFVAIVRDAEVEDRRSRDTPDSLQSHEAAACGDLHRFGSARHSQFLEQMAEV